MKRFFLEVVMKDEIEGLDLLALIDGTPRVINGVNVGTVLLHDIQVEKIIHGVNVGTVLLHDIQVEKIILRSEDDINSEFGTGEAQ